MIDFHRPSPEDREQYNRMLMAAQPRGCEYSFANVCLWGRQQIAWVHDCAAFFSHYNGRSLYPYPIGNGDRRAVIEDLIRDAEERGIPCRLACMCPQDVEELESWFPGRFTLRPLRDTQDYVYSVDDLADLKGRKFQRKRNHMNRFRLDHPDCHTEPITPENLEEVKALVARWYADRAVTDPDGDYVLEKIALERAFCHYEGLGLEGIALREKGELIAMTMASPMGPDTWDVHFEKAREDVAEAYAAVNCEFARYMRQTHPELRFLDREDDMGLEGLRKAKLSYNPHHMVEKFWAFLGEDIDEI